MRALRFKRIASETFLVSSLAIPPQQSFD